MDLTVREFNATEFDLWDEFCDVALQATPLHTRKFLSYHGDRFQDVSLMIELDNRLVGLFPAAISSGDTELIVSHPGITFGGILHAGKLKGDRMISAFHEVCRHYRQRGFVRLLYKAVPHFYHTVPSQDDIYALFRLGAHRIRCDLSCSIDLAARQAVSDRRRRSLKKAKKASASVVEGFRYLSQLWPVLERNLQERHHVAPVHTIEEISFLAERFPEQITCAVVEVEGSVEAGVVILKSRTVHHAQYITSSARGSAVCALDAVFEHCIRSAAAEGARWFDFGISNENDGLVLNDGLYQFKSEFGGTGTVHEFYELDIREST